MKVSELMSTNVIACDVNDTISHVAEIFENEDIGSCPVMHNDRLVGYITDRDIAVRAVAKGLNPNQTKVSQIMTSGVISIDANASIDDACSLMSDNQIRRLPIVMDNRLVGIVSMADLAVDLDEEDMVAETIHKISEPTQWH